MNDKITEAIQQWLQYMERNTDEFPIFLSMFHSLTHWKNVEAFGLMLADEYHNVDRDVVRWFAYLHDCRRGTERFGEEHGHLAANFISRIRKTFLKDLSDDQIATLKTACRFHAVKRRTQNLTADVCLDADRLDLFRVCVRPDPKKMATEAGARFAAMGLEELETRKNIYLQ